MKPVQSKRDFVRRYQAGEFGNRAPTWATFEEFWRSQPSSGKRYHLRNRIPGGPTYYNVAGYLVGTVFQDVVAAGVRPQDIYVSEMAPTALTLFQGEVCRGIWGLELTYSTLALPMRDALRARPAWARGIIVDYLLRRYLCPRSLEWLLYLLDEYEDHVVEFSTYATDWGTLPEYNTVFWEVRLY